MSSSEQVVMTMEEFNKLLTHPDWALVRVARTIVGYEASNFYQTLRKKTKDGIYFIRSLEVLVPGEPKRKFVYKPSLISFMKQDMVRLKKEANNWNKTYEKQLENLPKLQRMYPNA